MHRRVTVAEYGAAQVRSFQPLIVDGLVQTPEYAHAVISNVDPPLPRHIVRGRMDYRTRRQEVLRQPGDPLRLSLVLGSTAVEQAQRIDSGQVGHLQRVAQELPNVRIGVLDVDGLAAAELGAEWLSGGYRLIDGGDTALAATEGALGMIVTDDQQQLRRLGDHFARMEALAVPLDAYLQQQAQ
ncbi:MAG TPA: Scr1 family TA system antitoxin-like transcriptional regulator [Candidatus Saccharimonadales bacterium]|nr:Scr1 family TA system antitoxin-like transcriptional regulator [Candidatus Saccharimonadales bacterium]